MPSARLIHSQRFHRSQTLGLRLTRAALAAALLLSANAVAHADSFSFVGADGGAFNVAANWKNSSNANGVPGAADTASAAAVRILLDNYTANTQLSASNGVTLDLQNGASLIGTFASGNTGANTASGTILLEGAASGAAYAFGSNGTAGTSLLVNGRFAGIFAGNTGGATASLTTGAVINANVAGLTTTLGGASSSGNTINAITNTVYGFVTASVGNNLVLASTAFTNSGSIRALSGSNLSITARTFTNNSGGLVEERSTGTLTLGTFVNNNSGATFQMDSTATLNLNGTTFTNAGTANLGIVSGSGTLTSSLPNNSTTPAAINAASVALSGDFLRLTNATFNATNTTLALNNGATLDVRGNTMLNSSVFHTLDSATLSFGNTGNNTAAGRLLFEGTNSASPTYNLGSGLTITGRIGSIGTSDTTINNGAVTLNTAAQIFANVSGNTTTIGASGANNVNTLTNTGTISATNGNALALNARTFTNSGSLIVGTGTSATIGGTTTGQSGANAVTRVDGSLTLSGSNPFTVSGGTVQGAGTIVGNLSNSAGVLSPGDSPGKLTLTGNYTQGSAASMFIEIGGTGQGTTYDLFAISGTATLGGTLNIGVVSGFKPVVGQTFDFLTYGSRTGTFASVFSLDNNYRYDISYGANAATLRVAAVPEPSLVVSLSGGLGLLALARKRARKTA